MSSPIGDGRNFSIYLRRKLETRGDRIAQLDCENVVHPDTAERNHAIEALARLFERNGDASFEGTKQVLAKRA